MHRTTILPFPSRGKQDLMKILSAALNLGEVLRGSRIYDTPYTFKLGYDEVENRIPSSDLLGSEYVSSSHHKLTLPFD